MYPWHQEQPLAYQTHLQMGEKKMRKVRDYFRSKSKTLSYRITTVFPCPYISVTESFPICPIRKSPAASQFLPNHHLFLMDYADTMRPGQGPPSPSGPAVARANPGTHPRPPTPGPPAASVKTRELGRLLGPGDGQPGWDRWWQAGVERVSRGKLAVWTKGLRGYQKTCR